VLDTPLEHHRFQHYSNSHEIEHYLTALALAAGPYARVENLGRSAEGRPLQGLYCERPNPRRDRTGRLRILLVGSQHGASEAAGGEALLMLARALLLGEAQDLLDDFDFLLIPNANPDGRERDSSRNGNDINLNRDFVLLSQPESAALDAVVLRYQPDVILDAHESASLKQHSLGREGYLTDFEAQFDIGNSPAVAKSLREFAEHALLPALFAGVSARGLRVQRYIREITSTRQPITHGVLTARNFRNKAALRGCLTVLLETPMEPKAGVYPSFRNIEVRAQRQITCMEVFLAVVRELRLAIARARAEALRLASGETIALNGCYVRHPHSPEVIINLRHRDTWLPAPMTFEDWRCIEARDWLAIPSGYVVRAHHAVFANLFSRHAIPFEILAADTEFAVEEERFTGFDPVEGTWNTCETVRLKRTLPAGSLHVPLTHQTGRLLPLLLEPRSESSVFRYLAYARLLEHDPEPAVARCLLSG
jgi:hypothetical protein